MGCSRLQHTEVIISLEQKLLNQESLLLTQPRGKHMAVNVSTANEHNPSLVLVVVSLLVDVVKVVVVVDVVARALQRFSI